MGDRALTVGVGRGSGGRVRSKAQHWKCCTAARLSWVQIPACPPVRHLPLRRRPQLEKPGQDRAITSTRLQSPFHLPSPFSSTLPPSPSPLPLPRPPPT